MKDHEGNTTAPENSSANSAWDMQDVAFAGAAVPEEAVSPELASEPESTDTLSSSSSEVAEADPSEQILAAIKRWSTLYDEEETDFQRFVKQWQGKDTSTPEAQQKYQDWLRRSEQMAQMAWQEMQRSTNDAVAKRVISGRYEVARAQNYGQGIAPGDTIEAASAVFYQDRMTDLVGQVNADEGLAESERQEKLRLLGSTWRRVSDYLESTSDLYDGYDGQRRRTAAHNAMIRQLNSLNDLAREYDLQPFTFRNFMTNDFSYDKSRDRSGVLNYLADHDRETVANYFRKVFARDIAREEEREKAKKRLFR